MDKKLDLVILGDGSLGQAVYKVIKDAKKTVALWGRNGTTTDPAAGLSELIASTNRQSWLATISTRPHVRNTGIRKSKYKKFWTLIQRYGGWNNPHYLRKKITLLRQSRHMNEDESWITMGRELRDIMPECVTELVRSIYPNPENVSYMGHRW